MRGCSKWVIVFLVSWMLCGKNNVSLGFSKNENLIENLVSELTVKLMDSHLYFYTAAQL